MQVLNVSKSFEEANPLHHAHGFSLPIDQLQPTSSPTIWDAALMIYTIMRRYLCLPHPTIHIKLECPVPLPLATAVEEANTPFLTTPYYPYRTQISSPSPSHCRSQCGVATWQAWMRSPPRTLRSSPAPSSSPSSGCASLAEDSGADGTWVTLPSNPALSWETLHRPLLLVRPPLLPPNPHPPHRPPGFSLGSGPTSWSFNPWEHPRFLGRHISSNPTDVTVSVSISVAQDCPPPCPYRTCMSSPSRESRSQCGVATCQAWMLSLVAHAH